MEEKYIFHSAFDENPFRFVGENSILNENHLGIAGVSAMVLTPESSAAKIAAMQNPPYTATSFGLEVRIGGERIPGRDWVWLPNCIRRSGTRSGWRVETVAMMPPSSGACLFLVSFTNESDHDVKAPIQIQITGSARKDEEWIFTTPHPYGKRFAYSASDYIGGGSRLILHGSEAPRRGLEPMFADDTQCVVTCSMPDLVWFSNAELWETTRMVRRGETVTLFISVHLGSLDDDRLLVESEEYIADYLAKCDAAFAWLDSETKRIFEHLPKVTSDNPELDAMYYRSVVTYCLNRWENPHFAISPYYSTGSITGGCMCSYLWDYSGGMMLHPLIDPEINKIMIRAYLHADLCTSYAIKPLDGKPTGPWYHINQEKIIGMIYYHVLHTGDTEFLAESIDGRTIAEWAVFHACVGDDLSRPVSLIDYGEEGRSHLELDRKFVYQGIMPDLNARRYVNYQRAFHITEWAGHPELWLMERAASLKDVLETLWDEEAGWYDFIWDGKRDKRYTVQMFKFINSDVIDDHHRERLISHLNEEEFLSEFGLHSMSKKDEAYDQIDIDNGGGGSCTQFTMQITGQLYARGYDSLAEGILRRNLWLGSRVPYIGDSCVANMIMIRENTPLQADISSAAWAQTILFYVCGIKVDNDGTIRIAPPAVIPAEQIRVEGICLRGIHFDLTVSSNMFTVTVNGHVYEMKRGESLVLSD